MKKSTRALVGLVLIDLLLLAGTGWLVLQVRSGAWSTSVPPEEAIGTITSTGGAVIGVVSALLILAFFLHRKRGNWSLAKGAEQGWGAILIDGWLLAAEAWIVVGLRTCRLARGGPAACSEARLMVGEKIASGMELGTALLGGRLGSTPKAVCGKAVSHYLDGVRANRRRLLGG